MNRIEMEKKRRENIRKIEYTDRTHINCVRFNIGNTFKHELSKFIISWLLSGGKIKLKEDFNDLVLRVVATSTQEFMEEDFITEARPMGRKRRYDVFALTSGNIYEVETGKSYEKKGKNIIVVKI